MQDQVAVQNLLRKKYLEIQAKNPAYSVRAFASRLGLHASATNEIMKGERRISGKIAERIADKLLLDPTERAALLRHFDRPKNGTILKMAATTPEEQESIKISADQFAMISNWVHFALLSLVKTRGFDSSLESITHRLGVSEKQATEALERLERLGLLLRDPATGKLKRKYPKLNTQDDVLNISIQKAHIEDMELAKTSIMNDPVDLRDFSSVTMAVSTKLMPKAKELIRKMQDELSELLSSEPADEVYRMNVHLFPLTKLPAKGAVK